MIKEGFVLRRMPGMNLVMPTGANANNFKGALMLNDTGAFIFGRLQENKTVDQIAMELTQKYDVAAQTAGEDVIKTIASLREAGVWQE